MEVIKINEILPCLVICILSLLLLKQISKVKFLKEANDNLRKANDNILKSVPDIRQFINIMEKKEDVKPVESTGVQLFVVTRAKGAPDIRLGEISEIYIASVNREKATKLLKEIKSFKDDGWWILDTVKNDKIVSVRYLGGFADD